MPKKDLDALLRYAKGNRDDADDGLGGKPNTDPWNHSASGHGYAGERWNDDTGYVRGAQSQGSDDAAFLRPSQSRTDQSLPQDISGDVFDHSGPAGPLLTGAGPVKPVGGDVGARKRYKLGKGPASNGGI
jgi:hypothetical protein